MRILRGFGPPVDVFRKGAIEGESRADVGIGSGKAPASGEGGCFIGMLDKGWNMGRGIEACDGDVDILCVVSVFMSVDGSKPPYCGIGG